MRLAIFLILVCLSSTVFGTDGSFFELFDKLSRGSEPKDSVREKRVKNGISAAPHQFPYQVAILAKTPTFIHLCSGSILSENAVLTAAHCLYDGTTSFVVIAGAYNRNQIEPNQQRRYADLTNFISHPEFDPNTLHNDVAVIRLSVAFNLNKYVQSIELASNDDEKYEGGSATVSGFGIYDKNFREFDFVMYAQKMVISNDECLKEFPLNVIGSTICAVSQDGKDNSVCIGDSGGPLTIQKDETSILIGIVSFPTYSEDGCGAEIPNRFTRVSSFNAWIQEVAELNSIHIIEEIFQ